MQCAQCVTTGAPRCDACEALDVRLRRALHRHRAELKPLGGSLHSAVRLAHEAVHNPDNFKEELFELVASEAMLEPEVAERDKAKLERLVTGALDAVRSMEARGEEVQGLQAAALLLEAQLSYWTRGHGHRWHPVRPLRPQLVRPPPSRLLR